MKTKIASSLMVLIWIGLAASVWGDWKVAGDGAARDPASAEAARGVAAAESSDSSGIGSPSEWVEVVGRCVNQAEEPHSGASVFAELTDRGLADGSRVAGPTARARDGRFALRVERDAFPVQLVVAVQGFRRVSTRLELPPADTSRLDLGDLIFERATRVRGRVLDTEGAAVAGVELLVSFRDESKREDLEVVSARDGRFDLGWLSAGGYRLQVLGKDSLSGESFVVGEQESPQALEVLVAAPSEVVLMSGVVRDERGEPVAGARVEAADGPDRRRLARSDAAGRFRLERRAQGASDTQLFATAEGYAPSEYPTRLEWGARDVEIILSDL